MAKCQNKITVDAFFSLSDEQKKQIEFEIYKLILRAGFELKQSIVFRVNIRWPLKEPFAVKSMEQFYGRIP